MGKMTGHPIVRMRHEVLVPSLCCIWSSPLIEWANPNKTDGQKATNKCSTLCGAKDKNRMLHAVWGWRTAVAFIGIGCLIWANNLSYCPMSNKKWAHEYHHMHTCCFYVSKPDPIESHKSQPSQRNKWILAKSFHCVAHFITRTVFFFIAISRTIGSLNGQKIVEIWVVLTSGSLPICVVAVMWRLDCTVDLDPMALASEN